MSKSEVYSWRLSLRLKQQLEKAARLKKKSLEQLLEEIAANWLEHFWEGTSSFEERQQAMRDSAMESIGALHGKNPNRAETVSTEIRARLAKRHRR